MPFPFSLIFERGEDLYILPRHSKQAQRLVRRGRSPAVSWNGQRLVYVHDRAIWVTEIHAPQSARPVCPFPSDILWDNEPFHTPVLSWQPNHSALAFSAFRDYVIRPASATNQDEARPATLGSIYKTSVPTKNNPLNPGADEWLTPWSRGLWEKGLLSASCPAWSPNGKYLALARGGALSMARITSTEMQFGRPNYGWDEWPVDGVKIEGGDGGSDVMGINSLSWSPNGRAIVSLMRRWNGGSYSWLEWHTMASGKAAGKRELPTGVGSVQRVCFTPDGRSLLLEGEKSGAGGIFRHDLSNRREELVVRDANNPACFV